MGFPLKNAPGPGDDGDEAVTGAIKARSFSIEDWDPKHQLKYMDIIHRIPGVYRTYIYDI